MPPPTDGERLVALETAMPLLKEQMEREFTSLHQDLVTVADKMKELHEAVLHGNKSITPRQLASGGIAAAIVSAVYVILELVGLRRIG